MLLENGKIETISYKNGQFIQQASFQVSSEGFSTGEWDHFDPTKIYSADSSQCLYIWDASKSIVPIYSNNHKQGAIRVIAQSQHTASLLATLNDRSQINT